MSASAGSLLESEGVFFERISWQNRAFIPDGESGIITLSRIMASKPVVELIGEKGLESRVRPMAGDSFTSRVLNLLGKFDDLFQQSTPSGRTVEAIGKEIDKRYTIRPLGHSMTKRHGAEQAWEVSVPDSIVRSGIIFQKGDDVWINVAGLRSGIDSGSKIYGIAAAYAHNTGRVLKGDPDGLSPDAFFRRTENMLSSVLKFGTSRHLEPHYAQEHPVMYFDGNTEAAGWEYFRKARPVKWVAGNDAANLRSLIYTAYQSAIDHAPEIKNVRFDFDQQQFVWRDVPEVGTAGELRLERERTAGDAGSAVPESFFTEIARRVSTRQDSRYYAGGATLKRAALIDTLLRERSEEGRRRILDQIGDELPGGLTKILCVSKMLTTSHVCVTVLQGHEVRLAASFAKLTWAAEVLPSLQGRDANCPSPSSSP